MDVRIWKVKAERFRRAAKSEQKEGRYDVASFSAHQAVELYLKGLIIERTGSKPYTHLLTELLFIVLDLFIVLELMGGEGERGGYEARCLVGGSLPPSEISRL